MSENKRLRVLKNIAGGLLLVSVLHYVLDEPTRSMLIDAGPVRLIRLRFERRNQPPPLPPDHPSDYFSIPRGVLDLVADPSFERWEVQSSPIPHAWFSTVTISVSEVVKRETEIVQHGQIAVRLQHDGVGHCGNVRQELLPEAVPRLQGRRLRFSAWTLSTTAGAPCLHIDDGINRSSACLESPYGAWQPLTVERVISPEATRVLLIIDVSREATGETAVSVFVDNASLTADPPSSEAPGAIAVTAPLPSPLSERR